MSNEITREQIIELIKSKRLQLTLDMYSWDDDIEANAKILFDGETLDHTLTIELDTNSGYYGEQDIVATLKLDGKVISRSYGVNIVKGSY